MSDTYKKLGQSTLTSTGTPVAVYTAGVGKTTIVKHIRAVNRSSSNDTALKIWQSTSSPSDDTTVILPAADIGGGGWVEFEGTIILNPGESLWAARMVPTTAAVAQNITVTVYGLEMS